MASHNGRERKGAWLWRKSCQIIPKPSTQIPKLYCCDLRSATYTIVLTVKEAFTYGKTSTICARIFCLSIGGQFWEQSYNLTSGHTWYHYEVSNEVSKDMSIVPFYPPSSRSLTENNPWQNSNHSMLLICNLCFWYAWYAAYFRLFRKHIMPRNYF